jgi:hypothetical protein
MQPDSSLNDFRTIGVSIFRDADTVYRYASNPENLVRWLKSFVLSAENRGGQWILHTPNGSIELTFIEENDLGILDHRVTLPGGEEILNPMRVVPNGAGSTVLFTLFRLPGMSDADFDRDAAMVQRDLETLKQVLEEG